MLNLLGGHVSGWEKQCGMEECEVHIYKIHQQDRVNGHTCLRTIFASFQLATIFYHLAVSSIVWGKFIGMMQ